MLLSTVVTSLSIVVVSLLFGMALLVAWRQFGLKTHAMIWALSFMASAFGHGLRIVGGLVPEQQYLTAMLACHASIGSFALLAWGFRLRAKRGINGVLLLWAIATVCILAFWIDRGVEWRAASRIITAVADAAFVAIIVYTMRRATGIGAAVRTILIAYGLYIASVAIAGWLARPGGEIADATFILVLSIGTPTGMIGTGILTLLIVAADLASELYRQSRQDYLTGLLNRRGFEEVVQPICVNHTTKETLIAVVTDLDHFKLINDRFGHAAGDDVIRRFADHLTTGVGPLDIVARIGGEEFAFVVRNSSLESALSMVENIRRTVSPLFADIRSDHPITASFGIAVLGHGEDFESAMMRADAALYRSKHAGRNRVTIDQVS